jgi:hypothetical protein
VVEFWHLRSLEDSLRIPRMQDYPQSLRLFLDDGYVMNSNILTIVQPTVTVEILNETIKGPV